MQPEPLTPPSGPFFTQLTGLYWLVFVKRALGDGEAVQGYRAGWADREARSAIPTKRNEEQLACPDWAYNNRNIVERLWARLKEWRAVATRYEKTAVSFAGVLCLAATLDWLS